jgi:glutathione S-transferase
MPAEKRNWKLINLATERTNADMAQLEKQLEGRRFLLGDQLSLGDIPAGAMLYRYFELEIERPRLPNVERWYAALKERPAYREHVMVSFGELFGRIQA